MANLRIDWNHVETHYPMFGVIKFYLTRENGSRNLFTRNRLKVERFSQIGHHFPKPSNTDIVFLEAD